ncbi:hypothetical protein P8452_62849 [Trifolium repens]|nr:hypothetical protein P8452_62849 [Trifolium repens]
MKQECYYAKFILSLRLLLQSQKLKGVTVTTAVVVSSSASPSLSELYSVLKIKLGKNSQKLCLRTRTPHSSPTIADSKSMSPPASVSNN